MLQPDLIPAWPMATAESEIAAIGQPVDEPPAVVPPTEAAPAEAVATLVPDEGQATLQYPAPPPSLAGTAAESVGAEAPPTGADNADAVDAIEMPRSGEMVAAVPVGDAAVAEAGDITPEPSIGAAESEGDARSLAERASGSVEAQDLSIRAAEAEADKLYVAGEAAPGTLVRVYANDELVGEARAGAEGTWLLEAEQGRAGRRGRLPRRGRRRAEPTTPVGAGGGAVHALRRRRRAGAGRDGDERRRRRLTASRALCPSPSYVIIRRGDNLWRIARRNYGRGISYQAIFAANRDRIRNPHLIFPGQVFVIPTRDRELGNRRTN